MQSNKSEEEQEVSGAANYGAAYKDDDIWPTLIGSKYPDKSAKRRLICKAVEFTLGDISKSLCDKVNFGLFAY